jgi:hypothetical protein
MLWFAPFQKNVLGRRHFSGFCGAGRKFIKNYVNENKFGRLPLAEKQADCYIKQS